MTKLKALIRLARPVLVLGAILVYALGVAMGFAARGRVDWPAALAGFGVTLLVNVMAHYADDYADQDTDALTRRTTFSGGSGVLPSGLVPAVWALRMAWGLGLLALVSTVLFIAAGRLPLVTLAIVGLALLGAWFYSMPPISLERHGLGELDNALVGALLTPLMGYATQTGGIEPVLALSLLPVFAIAMAGLLGAHWSDQEADAAVGRRNLTIQLGRRVRWLHTGMVVIAHVLPLALVGTILPWPVVAGVSLSLPLSVWATWQFSRSKAIASSSYAMMFYIAGATAGWVAAGMLRPG
jgi:1,4-dihydroxy-2-naphthoate octaprenyltransferase